MVSCKQLSFGAFTTLFVHKLAADIVSSIFSVAFKNDPQISDL